ncbi:polymer-forming cytoskeletal protein [Hydrogenophaga sp. 5NK40-0174]|uniref:bactofilin family protein n=1 Tax=Hydrogenophaga sp. 5NK40-0174 TaxID=3127649 RepID=UPI00310C2B26
MALHFGKREPEQPKVFSNSNTSGTAATRYGNASTPSTPGATSSSTDTVNTKPNTPVTDTNSSTPEGGSKLTVGPNIKLKGVEITDCDTLVVEGLVEATMDSRVIQIAEQGAFKGSVEIDIAEIRGKFDGNLTVRQKLVIFSTGKVTGKIRYGKVVIEEGGQLSGDIQCSEAPESSKSSAKEAGKPAMALAA